MNGGAVVLELGLMLESQFFKVGFKPGLQRLRERDDAVFPAFGIVDLNGVVVKIEVFDAQ